MSTATLNGHRVTSARANIPSWGCWHAEVKLDADVSLTGSVTLILADLTLVGTVLSGGPALGRSSYRIVGGAGGWGRSVASKGYVDDSGVKLSTVIGDAAREVGETVAPIAVSLRTGPAFAREEGPASAVLHSLAKSAWYVDEAGVTRLGARSAGTLPAKVTRITPLDQARGRVVLASESISAILPGVVVDGMTAVDVLHEVSAAGGLRSTVWGGPIGSAAESMRKLVDALDPDRNFRGVTEYRVDTLSGSRVNLQPVRTSSGMPYLKNVVVRPGVAGCEATLALGSKVLVGFADSDQSRPFVAAFEDAEGDGFLPTSLTLLEGTLGAARTTDEITISSSQFTASGAANGSGPVTISAPLKGTITGGSTKVMVG